MKSIVVLLLSVCSISAMASVSSSDVIEKPSVGVEFIEIEAVKAVENEMVLSIENANVESFIGVDSEVNHFSSYELKIYRFAVIEPPSDETYLIVRGEPECWCYHRSDFKPNEPNRKGEKILHIDPGLMAETKIKVNS